jgi:hypothetical protein
VTTVTAEDFMDSLSGHFAGDLQKLISDAGDRDKGLAKWLNHSKTHSTAWFDYLERTGQEEPSRINLLRRLNRGELDDRTPGPDEGSNQQAHADGPEKSPNPSSPDSSSSRREDASDDSETSHVGVRAVEDDDASNASDASNDSPTSHVGESAQALALLEKNIVDTRPTTDTDGTEIRYTLRVCPKNQSHDQGSAWVKRDHHDLWAAGCFACSKSRKDRWDWYWLLGHLGIRDMPEESGGDDERESQADRLVSMALESYTLHITDKGEVFMVPVEGPRIPRQLRGGRTSLRASLAASYRRRLGKVPSQAALADAMNVLEGEAEDLEPTPLHLRVAEDTDSGVSWVDIGDQTGEGIWISPERWGIGQPPMMMRRTALTAAFPRPAAEATIADLNILWKFMNVAVADRPLILAIIVASLLYPNQPHAIVLYQGEAGTAKTTNARRVVDLTDPSTAGVQRRPKSEDDWIAAVTPQWTVALDNLPGEIPEWLSNALCCASTGDSYRKRKLFTDSDTSVVDFMRQVVLTGIDVGAPAPDLSDRIVSIDLEVIDPGQRMTETKLKTEWAKVYPTVLGAVLALAVEVRKLAPDIDLEEAPRMADYAHTLAAVDKALGTSGLSRYVEKQARVAAATLGDDPFISAVMALVQKRGGSVDGTSATLLDQAEEPYRRLNPTWKPTDRRWPKTARQATQRLKVYGPAIRKSGWGISHDDGRNHDNAIRWTVTAPVEQ